MAEGTPTLDEALRRRADLYRAIVAVEHAAARPAVGREDEWRSALVEALETLEQEIADHVEITERPDGLYAEIVEAAPRLRHNVGTLRDEHPRMQAGASGLKSRIEAGEGGVEEARDETQRLLGLLVKHRQRGADLLWEAYSLDTGGSD